LAFPARLSDVSNGFGEVSMISGTVRPEPGTKTSLPRLMRELSMLIPQGGASLRFAFLPAGAALLTASVELIHGVGNYRLVFTGQIFVQQVNHLLASDRRFSGCVLFGHKD
jgi:hypothetical protein